MPYGGPSRKKNHTRRGMNRRGGGRTKRGLSSAGCARIVRKNAHIVLSLPVSRKRAPKRKSAPGDQGSRWVSSLCFFFLFRFDLLLPQPKGTRVGRDRFEDPEISDVDSDTFRRLDERGTGGSTWYD